MKFLVGSSIITFLTCASVIAQEKPLAVDEGLFLKESFDFSPPEEKALDDQWLRPPEKESPFPVATLQNVNGVRTIAINGEVIPTWARSIRSISGQGAPLERQLREQGIRLFIIDVGLTADYAQERSLDTAPQAAFEQFKKTADSLLEAVPDAWIIIRFWMTNVGEDFAKKYPDALLAGKDGTTDWGFAYPPASKHTSRPNMLNEWRRYCGEHLYRFLHYLGSTAYAHRVAGFYLAAMNSGEWWYYKGKGDVGWDYSQTRKRAFERFVKHKYGPNPEDIAKAWGEPASDDLLRLPSLAERQKHPIQPNSRSGDYLQALNLPISNAARYFGRIIKNATGGKALVGMEIHVGGIAYPSNGTVFMNQLLDCPDIDFFGGPPDYTNRRAGSSPLYRAAFDSLEAHGKTWLNEGDYRTHMAFDTVSGSAGEPPENPEDMRGILYREFARGAIFGYSTYLMDFGWWFYEPEFIRNIGTLLKADSFIRETGIERAAEIAVVTDQESQLYGNYFANPTLRMLTTNLDRIGAGWDFFELRDFLEKERYAKYKFIIFLNIKALNDEERQSIEKIKSNQRVVLWMHDPGVIDLSKRGKNPAELVSELTGMQMRMGSQPDKVVLQPEVFERNNLKLGNTSIISKEETLRKTRVNKEVSVSDTSEGLPIGNLPSRIYSNDPDAEALATDAVGRAFFAMRRFPEWTSVYTAFCEIDAWLIRELAKLAGCHVWVDSDDIVFAAKNYVAIHAATDGEKIIRLPEAAGVFDLYQGMVLNEKTSEIKIPMTKGETRLFYIGDVDAMEDFYKNLEATHKDRIAQFTKAYPSQLVGQSYLRSQLPKAPQKTGRLSLMGVSRLQVPALLFAGPFASDDETTEKLDELLSRQTEIAAWQEPTFPMEIFGNRSDNFLHVVNPRPLQAVDETAPIWFAADTPSPWVSDYQLGMATGQSYAVALYLEAGDIADVRLVLAALGNVQMWVDGTPVASHDTKKIESIVQLSPRRKLVIFRVRGTNNPSGFGFKIAYKDRGRGRFSVPGSGVGSIAADTEALSPPPENVYIWLPPIIKK